VSEGCVLFKKPLRGESDNKPGLARPVIR
jgi:hypothetical protein